MLCFVNRNFNTPCPALGLGSRVGIGSDNNIAVLSIRLMVDIGVPVWEDKNDDKCGGAPGEYGRGPGIERDSGGRCL
jgi:hypothetical protein